MATDTFNFVNSFGEKVQDGTIDMDTHTFKWLLTNTAPVATNTQKSNLTEITAGNGYTAGGLATTVSLSRSTNTTTTNATQATLNATGAVGPFRYAALYDDTATNDDLVGWVDYGSAITMANGETFNVTAASGLYTAAV